MNPEENWQIIPDTHEAIIDEDTWLRVQELRKCKRRLTSEGKTSLFSGLVYCADCGSKLHFSMTQLYTGSYQRSCGFCALL